VIFMNFKKECSFRHIIYYASWLFLLLLGVNFLFSIANSFSSEDKISGFSSDDLLIEFWGNGIKKTSIIPSEEKAVVVSNIYSKVSVLADKTSFKAKNILLFALHLLKISVVILFFFLLTKILKTVVDKTIFESKNSTRLYFMGSLFLCIPLLKLIQAFILYQALLMVKFTEQVNFEPYTDIKIEVILGIVIILLGYVFKEGTRIYEEQKLTI